MPAMLIFVVSTEPPFVARRGQSLGRGEGLWPVLLFEILQVKVLDKIGIVIMVAWTENTRTLLDREGIVSRLRLYVTRRGEKAK
jgi:hypothetical protein